MVTPKIAALRGTPAPADGACATCPARRACLPGGAALVSVAHHQIRVARGEPLYRAAGPVSEHVYMVRYGSFKQLRLDRCASEMIVGFPGGGEFLGLEAIGLEHHDCSAIALEDSAVCAIAYASMRAFPQFFHSLISQNIREMQDMLIQYRRTMADQRLAAFLLRRSACCRARGYSDRRFGLFMTRRDIAAYLNLTPECLSRLLRRFQQMGLIAIARRNVELLKRPDLERIAASGAAGPGTGDAPVSDRI